MMDRRLVVDWIDATVSALGLKFERIRTPNLNDDDDLSSKFYTTSSLSVVSQLHEYYIRRRIAAQTISLAVQVEEFKAILPKDEVWNLCSVYVVMP